MTLPTQNLDLGREALRQTSRALMFDRVWIVRGKLGAFNPATGVAGGLTDIVDVYGTELAGGEAHLRPTSTSTEEAGGQVRVVRTADLSLPLEAEVRKDDYVRLLVCHDDQFAGLWMRVTVGGGAVGILAQARRVTVSNQGLDRRWSPV